MKKDWTNLLMNPIRLRIVQYLMIHEKGTAGEIKLELTDIPPASLYRHIKMLSDAGFLEVVEEKKIRGTIEKTYQFAKNPFGDVNEQDIEVVFQTGLLSLMTTFQKYFARASANPQKDLLGFSTSTLLLSDQEFMEVTKKVGNIFNEVISNKPDDDRKPRRITFISSPCEDSSF